MASSHLQFALRYRDIFTLDQHSYLDTSRASFVAELFDVGTKHDIQRY